MTSGLLGRKAFLIFFILFSFCVSAQATGKIRKVIVLNGDKWAMGMNSLQINGVKLKPGFDNGVLFECSNDSIVVKVPSDILLFFVLKKKTFRFALKDGDNYFLYKAPSLFNKVRFESIADDDLVRFKEKRYVKKVLMKYRLE